jgi:class 3 adenylate cyclase
MAIASAPPVPNPRASAKTFRKAMRKSSKAIAPRDCRIVVVFCDLRGYTDFTETTEPEEVLEFLREYHGALGPLVAQFEGNRSCRNTRRPRKPGAKGSSPSGRGIQRCAEHQSSGGSSQI